MTTTAIYTIDPEKLTARMLAVHCPTPLLARRSGLGIGRLRHIMAYRQATHGDVERIAISLSCAIDDFTIEWPIAGS